MTGKLWEKAGRQASVDDLVEAFTVGNDHVVDAHILADDCWASIAHACALQRAGILSSDEIALIRQTLLDLIDRHLTDGVPITRSQEDCHTAIEQLLVERLGDLGKKIHTGRSRNDQVLTALRLFTRRRILSVGRRVHTFASRLLRLAEAGVRVPMRGYTHTRPAMPTTVAVWLGSFVETLLDDVTLLRTAHAVNDQNPLGSAAGYGSPIELDRELTRELLGFERIQINALYCQNSRGKVEGTALHALASIQDSLAKLATDLIQFSTEEYGFVSLPDELTTGSSIMPQKRNPDVLELVRAKAGVVTGAIVQVRGIASGLGSGYHRDFQLVKEPLITSFAVVEASLEVMERMMEGIVLNEGAMAASCTREIYAADVALEKSRSGVPFRDAYRMAMDELDGLVIDEAFIAGRIDAYRTIGSMGNPCLDAYVEPLNDFAGWLKQREEQITTMEQRLRQPVS